MEMTRSRRFIFAAIIILAVLGLMEAGARLIESQFCAVPAGSVPQGWQTKFFGSLFEWHEPDPDLLWRFKAGLDNPLITTNSDHFLGPEISRQKTSNTYRVLVLGDSSPVGLGLKSRRQTFGEVLRYLLDRHFEGRKQVEVINAAVSGYSSQQVLCLLESKGWNFDPDLVVVYCGNNDASISGVYTDQELLAAQRFKSLRLLCSHLALYRVMRGVLRPQSTPDHGDATELKLRVSPEQYGVNLREIAGQCQNHNCPMIVIAPPVPYLWPAGLQFRPFLHLTGANGEMLFPDEMAACLGQDFAYCLDEDRFHKLYGKADIFTREVYKAAFRDSLTPKNAIGHYTSLVALDPDNPVWHNNLGVAYWKLEQYADAESLFNKALDLYRRQHSDIQLPAIVAASSPFLFNLGINCLSANPDSGRFWEDTTGSTFAYLDEALQADYFSLRIKKAYCFQIEKLRGSPGVAVIDMQAIFSVNGGEYLFIDHCHPTPDGHVLIAKTIYDTISSRRW